VHREFWGYVPNPHVTGEKLRLLSEAVKTVTGRKTVTCPRGQFKRAEDALSSPGAEEVHAGGWGTDDFQADCDDVGMGPLYPAGMR
jgi:hypothetical protein